MLRRTAGLLVAAIALVLATAGTASAHPLGNFTVNHYAGIELAGDRVYVRYVLDLAEIPTFQFGDDVRAAGFASTRRAEPRAPARRHAGSPCGPWRTASSRVAERAGSKTLRFDAVFSARGERQRADVRRSRLPVEDRLAGDHDRRARRRAAPRRLRPERKSVERAALVSR